MGYDRDLAVADTSVEAAGAPEAPPPNVVEAMKNAFTDWWADNAYLLDVGLTGDLVDLRLRLNAAFANCSISSIEVSSRL